MSSAIFMPRIWGTSVLYLGITAAEERVRIRDDTAKHTPPTHWSFPTDVPAVGPAARVIYACTFKGFRTLPGTFSDAWISPALLNEHFLPCNRGETVRG